MNPHSRNILIIGSDEPLAYQLGDAFMNNGDKVFGSYTHTEPKNIVAYRRFQCDTTSATQMKKLFHSHLIDAIWPAWLDMVIIAGFPFLKTKPLDLEEFQKVQQLQEGHLRAMIHAAGMMPYRGKLVNILKHLSPDEELSAPHYSAACAAILKFSKLINNEAKNLQILDVLIQNGSTQLEPSEVVENIFLQINREMMPTELLIDDGLLI
jgi:hypothetical protein